jgi:hypothetical protein
MKARIAPDRRFTWLRQIDLETAEDSTRRAHHHDFVREQDGFLDIVRDEKDGLSVLCPETVDVGLHAFARQCIPRREDRTRCAHAA